METTLWRPLGSHLPCEGLETHFSELRLRGSRDLELLGCRLGFRVYGFRA